MVTGSGQISFRFLNDPNTSNNCSIKINVKRIYYHAHSLPITYTCYNSILLPEYPTYEILKQGLDRAIKYRKERLEPLY